MPDEQTQTVQQQTTEPSPEQKQDIPLAQRVSQFKPEEPKPEEVTNPFGLAKEDYEKIQNDPTLSKFYKSMHSDYTRKTQELAEHKRNLEITTKWTPERIREEINKPDFIEAAQQVAGNQAPQGSEMTDEEWSALSDKEKAQVVALQNRVSSLEQQNQVAMKMQQDAMLKQTYANYDAQKVDTLLADMMSQRVQATREHLWKVLDYDSAVKRAYELGRTDERGGNSERVASMSTQGISTQPSQSIQPEEKESSIDYFRRIAKQKLAESKAGRPQRM